MNCQPNVCMFVVQCSPDTMRFAIVSMVIVQPGTAALYRWKHNTHGWQRTWFCCRCVACRRWKPWKWIRRWTRSWIGWIRHAKTRSPTCEQRERREIGMNATVRRQRRGRKRDERRTRRRQGNARQNSGNMTWKHSLRSWQFCAVIKNCACVKLLRT